VAVQPVWKKGDLCRKNYLNQIRKESKSVNKGAVSARKERWIEWEGKGQFKTKKKGRGAQKKTSVKPVAERGKSGRTESEGQVTPAHINGATRETKEKMLFHIPRTARGATSVGDLTKTNFGRVGPLRG